MNSRIWQINLRAASRRRTCVASGALGSKSHAKEAPRSVCHCRAQTRPELAAATRRLRANAVVVLGSAVCGSVTHRQDPSSGDMRAVAHRQSDATGLHAAPGPQRRPGVGFGPPAARLAGCNSAATARPGQPVSHPAAAGARAVGRFPGPPRQRVDRPALEELGTGGRPA